jgi:hypothetical protein
MGAAHFLCLVFLDAHEQICYASSGCKEVSLIPLSNSAIIWPEAVARFPDLAERSPSVAVRIAKDL